MALLGKQKSPIRESTNGEVRVAWNPVDGDTELCGPTLFPGRKLLIQASRQPCAVVV